MHEYDGFGTRSFPCRNINDIAHNHSTERRISLLLIRTLSRLLCLPQMPYVATK
jgi:hypothetical protein